MPAGNFVDDIKNMLREWNWPEWRIQRDCPKIVQAFVEVGILRVTTQGTEVTPLVADNDAWDKAWKIVERDGLTSLGEQAS